MSYSGSGNTGDSGWRNDGGVRPHAFDPDTQPELFRSVLTRRIFAFLIDLVVLTVPVILGYIFIAVFGVITLGLGWMLFWLAWPATVIWAIVYYGASIGGPHSATMGMRAMDLELRGGDPRRRRLGVIVVHGSVGNYLTGGPAPRLVRARDRGLHRAVGQHPDGNLRRDLRRGPDAQDPARHRRGPRGDAPPRLHAHRAARLQHGRDDGDRLPGPAPPARRRRRVHPRPSRLAAGRDAAAVGALRRRARATRR